MALICGGGAKRTWDDMREEGRENPGIGLARELVSSETKGPYDLAYEHYTIMIGKEVVEAVSAIKYVDMVAYHCGRAHATPRQERAFCDAVRQYTFASTLLPCSPRPLWLLRFTEQLTRGFEAMNLRLNSCVVYHFASGTQKLGEHMDVEDVARSLDEPLALVSVGAERDYTLRCQDASAEVRRATRQVWRARHGDVRFVSPATVARWAIAVPARKKVTGSHWLLMFRSLAGSCQT